MIKVGKYYRVYKMLFFMMLFFLLSLNFFISYGESIKYAMLASVFLIWVFYELYGMAFSGKWMVGLGIMVDENKGVGLQYVSVKWLLIPIYLVFAFGASLGGLWL